MRKILQAIFKIWTKTNPLDCLKKKKKNTVSPLQLSILSREDVTQHPFKNIALRDLADRDMFLSTQIGAA